jgi:hypothetical protein
VFAGAAQSEQRIVLDSVFDVVPAPSTIPIEETPIFRGDAGRSWYRLAAFTGWVVRIAGTEKAATAWGCLDQHAIAARTGRTIGDAVLDDVNIDARTERFLAGLFGRALYDFFYGEIEFVRMFAMQERSRKPYLVCDL